MTRAAQPVVVIDINLAEDLASRLSSLEEWLSNASYDTIDDLVDFYNWHDFDRPVVVGRFVCELGEYTAALRILIKEASR